MLVGTYPHAGEAEGINTHAADVIALATGGDEALARRPADMGGPQAIHVYRAKRKLRQLQPFLVGEMQSMVNVAVMHLNQWTTEHWGEEVELVEDSAPDQHGPQEGAARPSASTTTADGGSNVAARTTRPSTTTDGDLSEGTEPRRRRALDSPSSLDNDD